MASTSIRVTISNVRISEHLSSRSLTGVLLCLFRFDPLAVLAYYVEPLSTAPPPPLTSPALPFLFLFSSSGPSTQDPSLILDDIPTACLHLAEAISATPRDPWPGASRLQFELIEDGAKRLIRVYAFRVDLRLLGYSNRTYVLVQKIRIQVSGSELGSVARNVTVDDG